MNIYIYIYICGRELDDLQMTLKISTVVIGAANVRFICKQVDVNIQTPSVTCAYLEEKYLCLMVKESGVNSNH